MLGDIAGKLGFHRFTVGEDVSGEVPEVDDGVDTIFLLEVILQEAPHLIG